MCTVCGNITRNWKKLGGENAHITERKPKAKHRKGGVIQILGSKANIATINGAEEEKDLNPDKIQADKTCTAKPTVCLQSSTLRHLLQSIY